MIFAGEYMQGDRFSENQLTGKLGVSRTPIREALTELEREGLVRKIPQVGVEVRTFDDDDLREIFSAREFLEARCAETLARRPPLKEHIDHLEDLLTQMRRAADRELPGEFLAHDTEFHWRTADFAELPLYRDWLQQVGHRIRIVGFISTPGRPGMENAIAEHEGILEAIRQGDPHLAARACLHHLTETKLRLEVGHHRKIFEH